MAKTRKKSKKTKTKTSGKRKIERKDSKPGKKSSKTKKSVPKEEIESPPVDTKWIVRTIVLITIISAGLFVYFRQKAKERYDRTFARQQEELAEEQGKINLTCTGLFDISDSHYAFYANTEEGQRLVTEFDINLSGKLVKTDGSEFPAEINTGIASSYTIKSINPDKGETDILSGETTLKHPNKEYFASSEGSFQIQEGEISFVDLNLPNPPSGWRYSTWFVLENSNFLIKRLEAEESSGEKTSKATEIPEEFLASTESIIVITAEPDWYEGNQPFPFAILGSNLPENPNPAQEYNLTLGIESLPYCVVTQTSPWI